MPETKHVIGFTTPDNRRNLGGVTVAKRPYLGDLLMLNGRSYVVASVEQVDELMVRNQNQWRCGVSPAPWISNGGWTPNWLTDPPAPLPVKGQLESAAANVAFCINDLLDAIPRTGEGDDEEDDTPAAKIKLLVTTKTGDERNIGVDRMPKVGESFGDLGRISSIAPPQKRGGPYTVVCV